MQVLKVQQPNIYRNSGVKNAVTFGHQMEPDSFERRFYYDAVDSVDLTPNARLKSISFKEGTNIDKALGSLAYTKNRYLEKLLTGRLHPPEELQAMHRDIIQIEDVKNLKIKSLLSMGCTALVFETADGRILKVSPYDHFPDGRKPDDFDLPAFSGKSGYTHYYLQEKVSQENLSQSELREFVESIEKRGYYLHDYTIKKVDSGNVIEAAEEINPAQFGRAKNGKIYLIDPECATLSECKSMLGGLGKKLKRFFR